MPGPRAYKPYTAKEKAAEKQMAAAHALASAVNSKMGPLLAKLWMRWQDEREYEDFADYAKVMQKSLGSIKGAKWIAASKRPFGFQWKGNDGFTRITSIDSRGWVKTVRLGNA